MSPDLILPYRNFSNARALPEKIRSRSAASIGSALTAAIVLLIRSLPCSGSNGASVANRQCGGAKIGMPALGRSDLAVERSVGIEELEIFRRRALERIGAGVVFARAEENLPKAEANAAGKIRDHAAHVVGNDLELRQLVKQARVDQARHAGGRLVGPTEREPDLVLRRTLGRVVGELRAAHRMDPDRQIVRDHAGEDRTILGIAQRRAGHVGEDLDSLGAKLADGAVDLRERGLDVVHRQRCDERRETVRVAAAELGQSVIGHARQIRRLRRTAQIFERRIGEREHLLQVAELIEEFEPRIDIPKRAQARKGRRGGVRRSELLQALEVRRGHEVIEDVEHDRGPTTGGRTVEEYIRPASVRSCLCHLSSVVRAKLAP